MIADIQPHHLLQHLVPNLESIPVGVEIEYDDGSNKHAFTFTHHAAGLGFSTRVIYIHCTHLSEQFSLLVSFKTLTASDNDETLFAVKSPGDDTLTFAVTLQHGLQLVRVHYTDGFSSSAQTAAFRDESLFDGSWHSLVVTYSSDRIVLLVDCHLQHFTTVSRTFPSNIDIATQRFYIGNDGRRKRGIFSVSLHPLIFNNTT